MQEYRLACSHYNDICPSLFPFLSPFSGIFFRHNTHTYSTFPPCLSACVKVFCEEIALELGRWWNHSSLTGVCVCVSVCLRVKGVTAADYIPANNHGETTAGSVLLHWRDWLWIDSVRLRESQTAKWEDGEGESSVVYFAASLLIRLCQGKDDKTYRGGTDVSVAKLVSYEVKLINIQSLFYDLHPETAHFPVQRGKRRRHRWRTKTAHPLMSTWGWLQKCVPPPETPMLN